MKNTFKKRWKMYVWYLIVIGINVPGAIQKMPLSIFVVGWLTGVLLTMILSDFILDDYRELVDTQEELIQALCKTIKAKDKAYANTPTRTPRTN